MTVNLAELYRNTGNHDKAMEYFQNERVLRELFWEKFIRILLQHNILGPKHSTTLTVEEYNNFLTIVSVLHEIAGDDVWNILSGLQ